MTTLLIRRQGGYDGASVWFHGCCMFDQVRLRAYGTDRRNVDAASGREFVLAGAMSSMIAILQLFAVSLSSVGSL